MKMFTGWEYLLIDVANQYGKDKQLFETRIRWATKNLDKLEELGEKKGYWKTKPLYQKAVMAVRKAQQGKPTGHMVGFDAVCSGIQLMSTLSGCKEGAKVTGLIDTKKRPDAYKKCYELMKQFIPTLVKEDRLKVKQAVMTVFYGSKAEPKKLFGEDTDELAAFYRAIKVLSPGSLELLDDLLEAWQPYAMEHFWILPDNHHVHVKNMEKITKKIEVDELNHSKFIVSYNENVGKKKGISLAANVIHSIDGYVLRSLIRRCSYDPDELMYAQLVLADNLQKRSEGLVANGGDAMSCNKFDGLVKRYKASKIVDISIAKYLDPDSVWLLSQNHIEKLQELIWDVLSYRSFPIITVHDEFKCHANHMNRLRHHYKEILADLADSTVLDDVLSTITGKKCRYQKMSKDLSKDIRKSNYTLC